MNNVKTDPISLKLDESLFGKKVRANGVGIKNENYHGNTITAALNDSYLEAAKKLVIFKDTLDMYFHQNVARKPSDSSVGRNSNNPFLNFIE